MPTRADIFAEAARRGLRSQALDVLDQPFDPMRQIPAGMRPPLRVGDVASLAVQNAPGIGDIASIIEAYKAYAAGNPLEASFGALGALPMVAGMGAIKTYHGSPHSFDKFDMSKIGTGEGAQAYGHGLYFAESPAVARNYQVSLTQADRIGPYKPGFAMVDNVPAKELSQDVWEVADQLASRGMNIDQYINHLEQKISGLSDNQKRASVFLELLDQAKSTRGDLAGKHVRWEEPGSLYETSLEWPDPAREAADPLGPQHFLDWDKPLSEQSEIIGKAYPGYMDSSKTLPQEFGRISPEMSRYMKEQGIPGIRYLDQGSRGAGDGTYNYVVFDDQIPRIVGKR